MSDISGLGRNSGGNQEQKKIDELLKIVKKEAVIFILVLLPVNLVLVVSFFSLILLIMLGKYFLGISLLVLLFAIYIPSLIALRKALTRKSSKIRQELNIDKKAMRRLMAEDYKRKHGVSFGSTYYSCSRCGQLVSKDTHICPKCGVRLNGIRCKACNYIGSENEFVLGACPKCGGSGIRL